MALPVKPSDWQSIIASTGASLCTRLKLLLNNIGQYLYNYMSWMWQEDGELTDEAAEVISRKVSGVRPGTVMYMAVPQASVPSGYLLCDGRSLSAAVAAYVPLYSAIGTTWGGDGAPNFNIPNLLGDLPYGARNDTELGQETERAFLSHSAGIFAATQTINKTFEGIIQFDDVPRFDNLTITQSAPVMVSIADFGVSGGNVLRIPNDLGLQSLQVKLFLVVKTGDNDEGYDVGQEIDVTDFQWQIFNDVLNAWNGSSWTPRNWKAIYFPYPTYSNIFGTGPEGQNLLHENLMDIFKYDSLFSVTYDLSNINIFSKYLGYPIAFANQTFGTGRTDPDANWPMIECDLRVEITNHSLFDNAYSLLTTHGLTPVIKL